MPTVSIVGAGVIGTGWAIRFATAGWQVRVYDLSEATQSRLLESLKRARPFCQALFGKVPQEVAVEFCDGLDDVLDGSDWVQESLPEVLELKKDMLVEVEGRVGRDTPICSSTSGFKPSVLAESMSSGERLFVCHPFNPVYLLPLVEVVPHPVVNPKHTEQVMEVLRSLSMRPLWVRKEIDGHIADRLLEAVWREALWLVHDDIATTEEIDDAIKYGFGLRWAQMGLFETYRLGGGDAGMRHFLKQFGPALQWPWTKLTDVPELDEALIDKIADQSDAQAKGTSVREMEKTRDRNLVAILNALKKEAQ